MRKGLEPRRRRSEVAVVELVETTRTEECSDSGTTNSPTENHTYPAEKVVMECDLGR